LGCHWGLRRIPAFITNTKEQEKIWQRIQQVQADVINLPIGLGFSPSRWQVVINAMLEKIPGKPLLHKLHVIHILEADYNLTLKEIFTFSDFGEIQAKVPRTKSTAKSTFKQLVVGNLRRKLRKN
jgi:hypothetical protein